MDTQLAIAGEGLIKATNSNLRAVSGAAQMIAAICEAKADNRIPLLAGDKDALPALHAAVGSALVASHDLHKAQLKTMQLGKRLGIVVTADDAPACPCLESGGTAKLELATANGKPIAA